MIDDADFRTLTAGRWLMPVMALVGAQGGARFAELLARLGLSRSALAASLAALRKVGWLRRNPGHGHPLRPEYVPTEAGAPIAAFAAKVMAERARLGLEPGQMPRWSLPIIARLDPDPARFSTLKATLSPVTPRALSLTLKQLLATRLIDRTLEAEFPPTALYALTRRGALIAEAIR